MDDLDGSESAFPYKPDESARARRDAWNTGYRDGFSDGQESGLQSAFDHGYTTAAQRAFLFGQLQGVLTAIILSKELDQGRTDSLLSEGDLIQKACSTAVKMISDSSSTAEGAGPSQGLDTAASPSGSSPDVRTLFGSMKAVVRQNIERCGVDIWPALEALRDVP